MKCNVKYAERFYLLSSHTNPITSLPRYQHCSTDIHIWNANIPKNLDSM